VQVPAAAKIAVVPDTVQMVGVVEAKLTVNPELAVAVSVKDVPVDCAPMLPKLIVWEVLPVPIPLRAMVCVTLPFSALSVSASDPLSVPLSWA
jgi:hypothetical protein